MVVVVLVEEGDVGGVVEGVVEEGGLEVGVEGSEDAEEVSVYTIVTRMCTLLSVIHAGRGY